ncbi:hypothetical protein RJ641_029258 [Dillenia turbinata]|uniref:Uncharacterized protein n=1 Tax=Dillenia turbinata TaxID=194707 RepID=A0AAN8W1E9_9MAGN
MANDPLHAHDSISFSDFPEMFNFVISYTLRNRHLFLHIKTLRYALPIPQQALVFTLRSQIRFQNPNQEMGPVRINFKVLYKTLSGYENLIGFWRRSGHVSALDGVVTQTPLIFFEWGSSFISGSRVSPTKDGSFGVVKSPFIWIGLNPNGESENFLDLDCKFEFSGDFERLNVLENDLLPVNVNFMGKTHVVVEENLSFVCSSNSSSPKPKRIGFHRISS